MKKRTICSLFALLVLTLFSTVVQAEESELIGRIIIASPIILGVILCLGLLVVALESHQLRSKEEVVVKSTNSPPGEVEEGVDPIAEADLYLKHGRTDQAIEILTDADKKNPSLNLKKRILEILVKCERYDEAMVMYKKIYTETGGDGDVWVQASVLMLNNFHTKERVMNAGVPLTDLSPKHDDSIDPLAGLLDHVASAPSTGAAETDLRFDDEVDPTAEADIYMAYGRYAQAEEILLDAIGKNPSPQNKLKLLELYALQYRSDVSRQLFEEIRNDTEETGEYWEKAVTIAKSNPTLFSEMVTNNPVVKTVQNTVDPVDQADVHLTFGGANEAIEILIEARKVDPSPRVLVKLLEAYVAGERYPLVKGLFEEIRRETGQQGEYWEMAKEIKKKANFPSIDDEELTQEGATVVPMNDIELDAAAEAIRKIADNVSKRRYTRVSINSTNGDRVVSIKLS
jgi:tetratricopeptide (TPR) repeat protein